MIEYVNPFEYEAAKKLTPDQIIDFYIEDYNYSRFIQSRRNIFLVGERGTGKTMTMMYNSFPVKKRKAERGIDILNYDVVCIYIPCNTTLFHREEYKLLDEFQAALLSEHFLVLSIMDAISFNVSLIPNIFENYDENILKSSLSYVLDMEIPDADSIFSGLRLLFKKEATKAQKVINANKLEVFYENAISFTSGVSPLISCFKEISKLKNSHFVLMLDDAHDLNPYQIKVLNSWIAFRDNSLFSFKVATTRVDRPKLFTSSGGTILDGHDFTVVDMEQPQNKESDFGQLSEKIIERRLLNIGLSKKPGDFFPTNPAFIKGIEECKRLAEKEIHNKLENPTKKQINDFVYKYSRVLYFRRQPRANLPPYSGFDMLVHISTGVIRNLLEPCFWMYDRMISDRRFEGKELKVDKIPPSIQNQILVEISKKRWEFLREGLDKSIAGCSREQASQIYNLFDNLAILFRDRLFNHPSEPRAIVFTISDTNYRYYDKLIELLDIARKAQILYTYRSSAKDYGKKEPYYVPNRILWPERGLDPVGQHARVSIKARDLWAAAESNKKIPSRRRGKKPKQLSIF